MDAPISTILPLVVVPVLPLAAVALGAPALPVLALVAPVLVPGLVVPALPLAVVALVAPGLPICALVIPTLPIVALALPLVALALFGAVPVPPLLHFLGHHVRMYTIRPVAALIRWFCKALAQALNIRLLWQFA